jgi:hypothetical protein
MAAADPLDLFFDQLAEACDTAQVRAPSRLKSRTYSALVSTIQQQTPLCTLAESRSAGRGLCVFEELVRIAPVGETLQRANYCRVCHARVLGEAVEDAPIYWPNCPYVRFQNR